MSVNDPLGAGTRIGPYRIVREIGRGGSAAVFEAAQEEGPDTGPVALKVRSHGHPEADARFIREIETLRGLRIPGVVGLHRAGETPDLLWFAMDLVSGRSIRRAIQAEPTPAQRARSATRLGAELCRVLGEVHRHGFVHRDLKPSNVLVDAGGKVVVLDFGVARGEHAGTTLTRPGSVVGTLSYMAPEQITGLAAGPKADVFAVALLLYEGVAGARTAPATPREWLALQCTRRLPALATLERDVPSGLSTLVEHMLAFDPDQRPSAGEAAEALAALDSEGGGRQAGLADWPEPHEVYGRDEAAEDLVRFVTGAGLSVLLVTGPPGSGRHRLVEQLRRRAILRGIPSLVGTSAPDDPGAPVREWLEARPGKVPIEVDAGPVLEMWPHLRLEPAPGPDDRRPTLTDVAQAAADLIAAGPTDPPLLLVVDRFEGIDGLTARVLERLVDHPHVRVLCILDPRHTGARAQRLVDRLRERRILASLAATDLPAEAATRVVADLAPAVAPVPIQGCSALRAVEQGWRTLAAWRGERLDLALPPRALALSLVHLPLPRPVLDTLGLDLEALLARGVLRGNDRSGYLLATAAHRRVARALLADPTRAADDLARAVAESWPEPAGAATLAGLLLAGANPARALGPAVRAALHAEASEAWAEARRWLVVVDGLPRDRQDPAYLERRFAVAWCRAHVSLQTDRHRLRTDLVEQARRRARGSLDLLQCAILDARVLARQGDATAALTVLDQVLVQGDDDELLARAGVLAADLLLGLGDAAGALRRLDRLDALRGGRRLDAWQVRLDRCRADAQFNLGNAVDSAAIAHTAQVLAVRLGLDRQSALLRVRLGAALMRIGDRAGARAAAVAGRAEAQAIGLRVEAAEAGLVVAELAMEHGGRLAAQGLVDEAINLAGRTGHRSVLARGLTLALHLACLEGDPAATRPVLDRASEATADGPCWAAALARWYRISGDPDRAIAAGRAVAEDDQAGFAQVLAALEVARAYLEADRPGPAQGWASVAAEQAEAGCFEELALMARLVERAAAPVTGGEDLLDRALGLDSPVLPQVALEMEGRCRLRLGDSTLAARHFQHMRHRATARGDRPAAERARRLLDLAATR